MNLAIVQRAVKRAHFLQWATDIRSHWKKIVGSKQ
jgi:hypothetical protein